MNLACYICAGSRCYHYVRDKERSIFRCSDCGVFFVYPQPTPQELSRLYDEGYYTGCKEENTGYKSYRAMSDWLVWIAEERMKIMLQNNPSLSGKVHDVGCATGEFLQVAMKRGFQASGCDLSESIVQGCRERGLEVYATTIHGLPYGASTFDAITFFDSLEHTLTPVRDIRRTWELLKPGGMCVVSTPNSSSLEFRLQRKRWQGFYTSREHLFLFNPGALRRFFCDNGFERISHYTIAGDPALTHIVSRLFRGQWIDMLRFPFSVRHSRSDIKNRIKIPYYCMAERLGWGHNLFTMAFKKGK